MRKFSGCRALDDIMKDVKLKGMEVNTKDYDNGGDCVSFYGDWHSMKLLIIFNTFNGKFLIHSMITGEMVATNMSEELDNEDWYTEILNVFYKAQ